MPLPRIAELSAAFGIIVCAAIIALHAALLPEAHWRGDDFLCAAFARDFGWRYLWQARIDGWSPRPLSELLFYGYGLTAAALLRPLTAAFLGLLWAALFATTLVTLRPGAATPTRILIGLSIGCMFLLGHPTAQLFFWPAGAVAYLTTLAATSLAFFLLIDGRADTLAGVLALAASLAACAAASETGAIAAVPLAGVLAASRQAAAHRRAILLAPAWLVAGFVLWTLAHHRMVSAEAARHSGPLPHILHSLRPVPRILLTDLMPIWPAKLCLFLGVRWTLGWSGGARAPGLRATLVSFAAALMVAACASIAAGVFQFGANCCERHDSLRQCWLVLALAALAAASIGPRATRIPAALGPALLTAACLLGMAPRLPAMIADFRLMPTVLATSRLDWRSGRNRATPGIVFRLPPPTQLAGGLDLPPGRYNQPAANSWTAHGIMLFFGKQSLTILAPQGKQAGLPVRSREAGGAR